MLGIHLAVVELPGPQARHLERLLRARSEGNLVLAGRLDKPPYSTEHARCLPISFPTLCGWYYASDTNLLGDSTPEPRAWGLTAAFLRRRRRRRGPLAGRGRSPWRPACLVPLRGRRTGCRRWRGTAGGGARSGPAPGGGPVGPGGARGGGRRGGGGG